MGEKFPGWWRLESFTHSSFIKANRIYKPQSNTLNSKQVEVGLKIEGVQDIMGELSCLVILSRAIYELREPIHYALLVTITALRRSKKWQRNILQWPYVIFLFVYPLFSFNI